MRKSVFIAGLLFFCGASAHAAKEWTPVTVLKAPWLVQAQVDRSRLDEAKTWLGKLSPPKLPDKKQWPAYVRALTLYKETGDAAPGKQLRLTLRQAEVLGILPPLEGLTYQEAVFVLEGEGFKVLPPGQSQPADAKVRAVRLTGTNPEDKVELWDPGLGQ